MLLYKIFAFTMHGKLLKSHKRIINLKYQLRDAMKSFNCLSDDFLFQIFEVTLNISLKKHGERVIIL